MIYCEDVRKAYPGARCCESCHVEEESGFSNFCEIYDGKGKLTHQVCCRMYEFLKLVEK